MSDRGVLVIYMRNGDGAVIGNDVFVKVVKEVVGDKLNVKLVFDAPKSIGIKLIKREVWGEDEKRRY